MGFDHTIQHMMSFETCFHLRQSVISLSALYQGEQQEIQVPCINEGYFVVPDLQSRRPEGFSGGIVSRP